MTCPICKSETVREYRPFCSRRCADFDLARWVNGSYAIPTEEFLDGEDNPTPTDPDTLRSRH